MIDISKLNESDKCRCIIYSDGLGEIEHGILKSWNEHYLFVWFHSGDTAAACNPHDLSFMEEND